MILSKGKKIKGVNNSNMGISMIDEVVTQCPRCEKLLRERNWLDRHEEYNTPYFVSSARTEDFYREKLRDWQCDRCNWKPKYHLIRKDRMYQRTICEWMSQGELIKVTMK